MLNPSKAEKKFIAIQAPFDDWTAGKSLLAGEKLLDAPPPKGRISDDLSNVLIVAHSSVEAVPMFFHFKKNNNKCASMCLCVHVREEVFRQRILHQNDCVC